MIWVHPHGKTHAYATAAVYINSKKVSQALECVKICVGVQLAEAYHGTPL
jgi:hypothetical protein